MWMSAALQWIGALIHVQRWKVDLSIQWCKYYKSTSWKVASGSMWVSYSEHKANVRRPLVQLCTHTCKWMEITWPTPFKGVQLTPPSHNVHFVHKKSSCSNTKTTLNVSTRSVLQAVSKYTSWWMIIPVPSIIKLLWDVNRVPCTNASCSVVSQQMLFGPREVVCTLTCSASTSTTHVVTCGNYWLFIKYSKYHNDDGSSERKTKCNFTFH